MAFFQGWLFNKSLGGLIRLGRVDMFLYAARRRALKGSLAKYGNNLQILS